jgi:sec-independent protein translocase protein TatA
MEALTPWHLILIVVGFLVLFGSAKLPDAARSLGRSLRIFRSEVRAPADEPTGGATAAPDDGAVARWEARARAEEARAAELRARAAAARVAEQATPPGGGTAS